MYITSEGEGDSEMAKHPYDVPRFDSVKGKGDAAASAKSAAATTSPTITGGDSIARSV